MKFSQWDSTYTGNHLWVPERTIYLTTHGSRAYRTNTPESDYDLRGVVIPPKSHYLGCLSAFEQVEQHEPDLTIFELKKFLRLAQDSNPNVLEVLYTDPSDHQQVHPLGEKLLENRDLFLSKRVKATFSGYAVSQLKRMQRHYAWHNNPPKGPPERSEFQLPERTLIPADQLAAANSEIQKKLDSWSVDFLDILEPGLRIEIQNKIQAYLAEIQVSMDDNIWIGAARTLGYDDNFIELLDRERRYTARKKDWENYLKWKKERNPQRAALEAKLGFDSKFAYHLVRLLRMAREILETGKVLVKRPDWEELLFIRNGGRPIEWIIEFTLREDAALVQLAKDSKLPAEPDRAKISELCVDMLEAAFTAFGE